MIHSRSGPKRLTAYLCRNHLQFSDFSSASPGKQLKLSHRAGEYLPGWS